MQLLLKIVCQSHKLSVKESTHKIYSLSANKCTYNIMRGLEIVLIHLISDHLMSELLFLDEIGLYPDKT